MSELAENIIKKLSPKQIALFVAIFLIHAIALYICRVSFIQGILLDFGYAVSFWKIYCSVFIATTLVGHRNIIAYRAKSLGDFIGQYVITPWILLLIAYLLYGYFY